MTEDRIRAAMAFSGTFRKLGMRFLADRIQGLPDNQKLNEAIITASKQLSAALMQLRSDETA